MAPPTRGRHGAGQIHALPTPGPGAEPPRADDAEAALIGVALEVGAVPEPARQMGLAIGDFYKHAHRTVWQAIAQRSDEGLPVDLPLIAEDLRAAGVLDDLGGIIYLFGLYEDRPLDGARTAGHYAELVRSASVRRQLADASIEARQLAHSDSLTPRIVADYASRMAALAEAAAPQPIDRQRPALNVQPVGTVPTTPRPPAIIDGLLNAGELLVLGAARAVGKSWWGMTLALHLARGSGHFMGTLPIRRPARVLYCHGELDEWGAHDRWAKLAHGEAPPDTLIESFDQWRAKIVRRRWTDRESGEHFESVEAVLDPRLEETISLYSIEVLVVDPWKAFYGGVENSNDEADLVLNALRALQLRYGLSIIVLHHFGKASDVREQEDLWRGATTLADRAATRVTLTPHFGKHEMPNMTRHQKRRYANVTFLRRTGAPPDDFTVKWNTESGYWERYQTSGEGRKQIDMGPIEVAARCPAGGWASTKIAAEALELSQEKATELLETAEHAGVLESFPGPRRAKGWRVPEGAEA